MVLPSSVMWQKILHTAGNNRRRYPMSTITFIGYLYILRCTDMFSSQTYFSKYITDMFSKIRLLCFVNVNIRNVFIKLTNVI